MPKTQAMQLGVVFCRSNPIAPDPRVMKSALALSNAGYCVMLIGWDRTGAHKPVDLVEGLSCYRLHIRARFGTGIKNLWGFTKWQFCLFHWLYSRRKQYQIIHACDFDTVIPSFLMKLLFRKELVYDIFDFFADHFQGNSRLLRSLIKTMDAAIIRHADAVILADENRLTQIKFKPRQYTVIYNTPADQNLGLQPIHKKQDARFSLRLAYVGVLQPDRCLNEIIELVCQHHDWRLAIAGFGPLEEKISSYAEDHANIDWYGKIDYAETLRLSAKADVLFAIYDPAVVNNRFSSPNKVFEAMMLAKPVIVAEGTGVDEFVRRHNCGVAVEYGNTEAIKREITKLKNSPNLCKILGENGRLAYMHSYNWSIMEKRLIKLYRSMQKN